MMGVIVGWVKPSTTANLYLVGIALPTMTQPLSEMREWTKDGNMIRFNIMPGVGIGLICFGMRPAEVRSVFLEPPDGRGWFEGNIDDALLYPDLRFHFYPDSSDGPHPEGRLCWMVIRPRHDFYLFGRPLGDWTSNEILDCLASKHHELEPSDDAFLTVLDPFMLFCFDPMGKLIQLDMEVWEGQWDGDCPPTPSREPWWRVPALQKLLDRIQ